MEKIIGAFEARRRFGQLIEEVFYRHDHFIVERSGRPMAVIVPIEDYQKWQRIAKARVFGLLEQTWSQSAAVPAEELERDVEAALSTLRNEPLVEEGA